jgi:RHS repeat-associated protein
MGDITRPGFTGHRHDTDLDLIDMRGRLYDPAVRRFMQADPIISAPFFSEGLNPYSYTFNSPTNWVDPSGLAAECQTATCWSAAGIRMWGDQAARRAQAEAQARAQAQAQAQAQARAAEAARRYGEAASNDAARLAQERAMTDQANRKTSQANQHAMDQAANEARSGPRGAGEFGPGLGDITPSEANQQESPGRAPRAGSAPPAELANPAAVVCITKPEVCIASSLLPIATLLVVPVAVVGTIWWATSDDGPDSEKNYTDKEGKIAKEASESLGRPVSPKQIKDAIHRVKDEGLGRGGPQRNPDVKVNPRTGDVRPKTPNGLGDVIGNIFDFL